MLALVLWIATFARFYIMSLIFFSRLFPAIGHDEVLLS